MKKPAVTKTISLFDKLDELAAQARACGDTRSEGRYLDAACELGRIIYEHDYSAWTALPDRRKQSAPISPA